MSEAIVVFNAGSTSLKFAAYDLDAAAALQLFCAGRIDSMQGDPHFIVKRRGRQAVGRARMGRGPHDRPPDRAAFHHHLAGGQSRRHARSSRPATASCLAARASRRRCGSTAT